MQSSGALLRYFGAALGGLWLTVALAGEAAADLKLCNRTVSNVGVAVGYKDGDGWKTEGWWNLPASGCEVLLGGTLASRFYYVYAVDYDLGGEWRGKAFMCTQDHEFTIQGVADCEKRGYDLTGFFEIDTGNAETWTVQLTEPDDRGIGGQ
jgi:uncharacterized membrane protein